MKQLSLISGIVLLLISGVANAQCNSLLGFLRKRLGRRGYFPALRQLADGVDDDTLRQATRFDTLAPLERAWLKSLAR